MYCIDSVICVIQTDCLLRNKSRTVTLYVSLSVRTKSNIPERALTAFDDGGEVLQKFICNLTIFKKILTTVMDTLHKDLHVSARISDVIW